MEDTQQLQQEFEAIRDERRVHANTAVRIGEALLSLLRLSGENDIEAVLDRLKDGIDELNVQQLTALLGRIETLTVKDLTVEGLMEVFRLLIRQVNATSGDMVQTAAASEIETVVPVRRVVSVVNGETVTEYVEIPRPEGEENDLWYLADTDFVGWKCSWKNDDGSRTTRNTWMVGDQAWCHTENLVEGNTDAEYNNYTNRDYWRLVEATGKDFVVLSADIHETVAGEAYSDYNSHIGHIPAPKDEIVQFGYQPQADEFDEVEDEHGQTVTQMVRNIGRTSIQWEGSDDNGPFRGMWTAVVDFTMPGKPYTDAVNKVIDRRIVEFVNQDHSYHNSKQWVLVNNGVALPKVTEMGDWLSYFERDGVVNAKPYERYTDDKCLWQCKNATTDRPSLISSSDWELVAGTPTREAPLAIALEFIEADPTLGEGKPLKYIFSLWRGWNEEITENVTWRIYRATPSADTSDPEYYEGFVPNHGDTWNTAPSNPSDESDVKTRIAMKRTAFSNGGRCIVRRLGSDFEIHDVEEQVNKGEIWMELSDLERNGIDYIDTKFLIYATIGNGEQVIYLT